MKLAAQELSGPAFFLNDRVSSVPADVVKGIDLSGSIFDQEEMPSEHLEPSTIASAGHCFLVTTSRLR